MNMKFGIRWHQNKAVENVCIVDEKPGTVSRAKPI